MTPKQNEPMDLVVDALEWCRHDGQSLTQKGYDKALTLAKLQSEAVRLILEIYRTHEIDGKKIRDFLSRIEEAKK